MKRTIIIAALGQAEFVTADMVKDGAVIVDVGITRVKSDKTKSGWKLLGDVKFDEVAPQVQLHHPGTGRRRSDDDHLTDEKHAESGPARKSTKTNLFRHTGTSFRHRPRGRLVNTWM